MEYENAKLFFPGPNPDKPEPNRFEDKKIDHKTTKIRRHESLNVVLFRVFNLSCFRDCVSEFFARKNAKIITKVLIKSTAFANAVMEEYIKVAAIENGIEAQLLGSILTERNIPHRMRSYYDTAYDGLFQVQKGWGFVYAPESFKDEIREIISDLRKFQASIEDSPEFA